MSRQKPILVSTCWGGCPWWSSSCPVPTWPAGMRRVVGSARLGRHGRGLGGCLPFGLGGTSPQSSLCHSLALIIAQCLAREVKLFFFGRKGLGQEEVGENPKLGCVVVFEMIEPIMVTKRSSYLAKDSWPRWTPIMMNLSGASTTLDQAVKSDFDQGPSYFLKVILSSHWCQESQVTTTRAITPTHPTTIIILHFKKCPLDFHFCFLPFTCSNCRYPFFSIFVLFPCARDLIFRLVIFQCFRLSVFPYVYKLSQKKFALKCVYDRTKILPILCLPSFSSKGLQNDFLGLRSSHHQQVINMNGVDYVQGGVWLYVFHIIVVMNVME